MRCIGLYLGLALALCGSSACVRVGWQRVRIDTPPNPSAVNSLTRGETKLEDALAELGAPLRVYEHDVDGVAVAYGHFDSREYGVRLTVPVDQFNVGMDYLNAAGGLEGVVLFFDAELVLRDVREGKLGDIISAPVKHRPSFNE